MSINNISDLVSKISKNYRKIAVTGGAGFIGSHIIESLLPSGIPIVCIDDLSAGKMENIAPFQSANSFRFEKCDVADPAQLEKSLDGVDLIFHNAASKKNVCLRDPRRDLHVNGQGAFNIFELAAKMKVKKVVHASTGSVYGEPIEFPQTEQHPLHPISYYGVSKLAGERYAGVFNKLYGLDVTILRYFHVYGPRQEFHDDYGGVVSIFLNRILKSQDLFVHGDGTQERSFTNVNDVVKANLLMAVTSGVAGEAFNCASGIQITVQALAEFLIKNVDKSGKRKIIHDDWLVGDPRKFEVSNAKICAMGMEFEKDFWHGLSPVVEWTRQRFV